ncbi:MAG: GNAT family N-acetyltransferase [Actinomycetota bacterium]
MTGMRITMDISEIDLDTVHTWLSTDAYWAMGRSRETVEKAARASLNFGVLDDEDRLIGYARVVTDEVTFAWLCDVYIARSARGSGAGTMLASAVVERLRPFGLKRVLLATADAHGLYEKVGFVTYPTPEKLMVLGTP